MESTHIKRVGILLFPLMQVFFSAWVGHQHQQTGKMMLIGNIFFFCCYLFIHFFFLDTFQKFIDRGKSFPIAIYGIKVVVAFLFWFLMGNYRIKYYFLVFFLVELYQILLFIPKLMLGHDWIHIVVESFFAGMLFPVLLALEKPFSIQLHFLWQFIPACLFIYLVKGIGRNLSIRLEKTNVKGLSLLVVTAGLILLQLFTKGLVNGLLFLLLIVASFVVYKRYQQSIYKQYILSTLLFIGTFLL
ncbi:hypothetical protein RV11_GL002471 [Enterococcus phoeniculicola]|jgi:hypothetical protein|uniref:Uncharacterized protein n=1 Tax=Enterococcus phoeniculicola ATCC BAA-412 TaxID=1158610 RepID=R3WB77_9ENTE|nr:hypothetical protein [Enterococcus phoeniculicola]EOL44722.1 hypothetical protein UC3_01539 [Enterococcus phoeniculicola ATCC BAA-412]EOT75011.1 hypothetical protein I589_02611 [Enterococcus phoeniculicola ATCC BAA-412]OJG72897.1 hypothetical protein RV11_GL002471 [Enterococcus phoeniculicola]